MTRALNKEIPHPPSATAKMSYIRLRHSNLSSQRRKRIGRKAKRTADFDNHIGHQNSDLKAYAP